MRKHAAFRGAPVKWRGLHQELQARTPTQGSVLAHRELTCGAVVRKGKQSWIQMINPQFRAETGQPESYE